MTEWLSTREVAARTGYSHERVRKLLKALDVPAMRVTARSHPRWHWPTVCLLFHVPQTIKSGQIQSS